MGNSGVGRNKHFSVTDAHTFSIIPTDDPISVTLPDGDKVRSTHKCVLDLPNLPEGARNGHIIPGLASNLLVSVVVLCNAGCGVTFKEFDVTVKDIGKIVLCNWDNMYANRPLNGVTFEQKRTKRRHN